LPRWLLLLLLGLLLCWLLQGVVRVFVEGVW
jgi:hypothetical protein